MAGGMDVGVSHKGGRKPLDAALNLVPFIDLMAVTIVFLIMTAVWTQLGKLTVSQQGGAGEATSTAVPVTLALTETSLRLTVGASEALRVQLTHNAAGALELSSLGTTLEEVRTQLPDVTALTLQADDGVPYADLVRVIDTCTGHHFPTVNVAPLSP